MVLGFFRGQRQKRAEYRAVKEDTDERIAKYDLDQARKKERVRQMKKETRELRLKPVKDQVSRLKEGFKSVKKSLPQSSKENYAGGSSDRTRAILSGSSGKNPFYDEPKKTTKDKRKSITIRL